MALDFQILIYGGVHYFGKVGELRLGIRRTEIIEKLGQPLSWLGKPPPIGPLVATAGEARVWYYYNNAVGVSFDDNDLVATVHVTPSKIDLTRAPFREWTIGPQSKVADLRKYLSNHNIPFREVDEGGYDLIAGECCVAIYPPYDHGNLLPKDERRIALIKTAVSEAHLPRLVSKPR